MRNQATSRVKIGCALLGLLVSSTALFAADTNLAKLPPATTNLIDFTRDIRPILENSCLRCHGPEKPRSRFRLDNHDDALKGGDKGADIVPGDSAKSPLIRYVAYLEEDMEMPPVGKGDQLAADQVAKLRAWIDQGVAWDNLAPSNAPVSSITFLGGDTVLTGDSHQYREHYWQREGPNGGVENFEMFDDSGIPGGHVALTGHALLNDYRISLTADKPDTGFIHSGWEQYRKYYDDTGGNYRPTIPIAPSLNKDLYLDIGKAWVDFGLTLPDWPQMTLGYEYDYKKGNEATTSWGADGTGGNARNIYPASKNLDEGTHVIKFDLAADVKGTTIDERFRGEFYKLDSAYTNLAARNAVGNNTSQGDSYFQGANTLRLEKQLTTWLFTSGGYFFSKLDANSSFNSTVTYPGLPATPPFVSSVPQITLERESHVFNLNGLLGPFDGLSLSAGVQGEWTHENGFGSGVLNTIQYTYFSPPTLATNSATLAADYDQNTFMENVALRYTKIPFTALFAEVRLQQETIGTSASDLQPTSASGSYIDNPNSFSYLTDMRVGFNTSPWRSITLSAHYRRYDNNSNYEPNQNTQPPGGYPGFIRSRDLLTDEAEGKLAWHPASWLKTTFTYQYLTSKFHSDTQDAINTTPPPAFVITPGTSLLAGETDTQVYSFDTMWTPAARWYLDAMFSYQPSRTTSATYGYSGIAPYEGKTYSVIANGTYVLDAKSDLFGGYVFSTANFSQNNTAGGVPVGIEYQMHGAQVGLTHRFNKDISGKLQYQFSYYDEPSTGGANNYRAHTVFATMTLRFR